MNALRITVFLLSIPVVCIAQPAGPGTDTRSEAETTKLRELERRIDSGEFDALFELAKMRPSVALPFIYYGYLETIGDSPQRREVARKALRSVQGISGYFREQLADPATSPWREDQAFGILSMIGTREAAGVVAPYVFDFSGSPGTGDVFETSTAIFATIALMGMKLADAPTGAREEWQMDDIVLWQRWAIKNGFVPKEWNSRVGLSEHLRKWRDFDAGISLPTEKPSPKAAPPK